MNYIANRDSAGNFVFNIRYDKIKIKTQNGDTETEADADNAALSINPVERMLGLLKQAEFAAVVNPRAK